MTLTKVQGRWVKYKFRGRDQNTAYSTCTISSKVMKLSSQVTGKMTFRIQGTLMTLTLNDLDILTNRLMAISQIISTEESWNVILYWYTDTAMQPEMTLTFRSRSHANLKLINRHLLLIYQTISTVINRYNVWCDIEDSLPLWPWLLSQGHSRWYIFECFSITCLWPKFHYSTVKNAKIMRFSSFLLW